MKNVDGWLEKNFEKMTASVLDGPMSEEDMVNTAIDYEIQKQEEEKIRFWEQLHKMDVEEAELSADNLDLDFHEVVGPLRQHDGNGLKPPQLPM